MSKVLLLLFLALFACSARESCAQTTEFTYQGSLKDSGTTATGNFDFEFKLFDLVSGGNQQGSTIQRLNVAVANGIFTVSLDFGAGTLPGADRFLDIAVRTTGGGAFTALSPRQKVNSAPYSVKSLNTSTADTATNAAQLGGVAANQYVVTTDPRMTDARPPTAGSADYIQNQNAAPQSSSNFNISGTGTANLFSAAAQYNIGANRILGNPGSNNLFAGVGAGNAHSTGTGNSFFGRIAGDATTTGSSNAFFGSSTGNNNVSGFANTLLGTNAEVTLPDLQFATAVGANASVSASNTIALGRPAGQDTVKIPGILDVTSQYSIGGSRLISTAGDNNLFVGIGAGAANAVGQSNSYFGRDAGLNNDGFHNSFFGSSAGRTTTSGLGNSFFGSSAGEQNISGERNSFFGYLAGSSNTTGNTNSFFGANAGDANTTGGLNAFFGSLSGGANTTASGNAFYGAQSGIKNTAGDGNTFVGSNAGFDNVTGSENSFFGASAGQNNVASQNSFFGYLSGSANTSGAQNSFFGFRSGSANGVGVANSYFGFRAGEFTTTGSNNAFFGSFTGRNTTTGGRNSYYGAFAGAANTGGNFNSHFGYGAGSSNQSGSSNSFFGNEAGNSALVDENSFFGAFAGKNTTTGTGNSLFGFQAGIANTVANNNSMFGHQAGLATTTGGGNAFFGSSAGIANTTGIQNAFFGYVAGDSNTSGNNNSFYGVGSGGGNSTGAFNVFIGTFAGNANTAGDNNTVLGYNADVGSGNFNNATAIGARASVSQSDSLVLGSINGVNGAAADTNVGIGTSAPAFRLDVADRMRVSQRTGSTGGSNSAGIWLHQNNPNDDRGFIGMRDDNNVGLYGGNGGGWSLYVDTTTGFVTIPFLGIAGGTALCRNASNQISTCSSSLRYKTNIGRFTDGLSFINRLRPISFDWKDGGMKDVGFGAEDIAKIDPRFATYNSAGQVEGVKYDRLSVVFVNAFIEQQTEINGQKLVIGGQQKQIVDLNLKVENQQAQINELKNIVCLLKPDADGCKQKEK